MTRILRSFARWYLLESWAWSLPRDERVRLFHWGATGNPAHHEYAFVDGYPGEPRHPKKDPA